ncbi:hypothetical protein LIP_3542 [Limnochorda pilosa]|uniref:Uncharacterized protein n=1 Tax=Limnochorda pilosa TaxID=1555112 RepID=A0A0K2SR96_LIMPI|nr:hypothetical protein LIP_3542 [Limnochorda pilosa]
MQWPEHGTGKLMQACQLREADVERVRGPLAQSAEQGTLNPKVQGSTPWRPTNDEEGLAIRGGNRRGVPHLAVPTTPPRRYGPRPGGWGSDVCGRGNLFPRPFRVILVRYEEAAAPYSTT